MKAKLKEVFKKYIIPIIFEIVVLALVCAAISIVIWLANAILYILIAAIVMLVVFVAARKIYFKFKKRR